MAISRNACLLALALVGGPLMAASPVPIVRAGFGASVDAHLTGLNAIDSFNGVALVARGDEILLHKGYGLADHERETAWAPDTVSCTGSITKQFTAACIMRLVEQGKVRVDGTLAEWFGDVPEDKAGITIHQLLTHTAGLADILGEDEEPIGRDALLAAAWQEPLAGEPGGAYAYSNLGYSILGAIVENASGRAYESFLRDELLAPAGCEETAYLLSPECAARLAIGYRDGNRWGTTHKNGWRDDGPGWHLRCNGGVQSTVGDLHRWVRALQTGRALKPESVALMWTAHVDEGGGESHYGYGWNISEPAPGVRVVGHNGGNGFYFADCRFIAGSSEESDAGGLMYVMMTNESRFSPVSGHIGRILMGDPPAPPPAMAPIAEAELTRLEGKYDFGSLGGVRIARHGAGIRLEGEGFRIAAVLTGVPAAALSGAEARAKRIETILNAAAKGDIGPIAEAYEGRVPADRLRAAYTDRFAQMAPRIGAVSGVRIVGAAPGQGENETKTLFRWVGDKGQSSLFAAAWEGERLVGFHATPLSPGVIAWPVGAGAFRAFDLRTGPGAEFHFEASGGKTSLRLSPDAGGLSGVKAD